MHVVVSAVTGRTTYSAKSGFSYSIRLLHDISHPDISQSRMTPCNNDMHRKVRNEAHLCKMFVSHLSKLDTPSRNSELVKLHSRH